MLGVALTPDVSGIYVTEDSNQDNDLLSYATGSAYSGLRYYQHNNPSYRYMYLYT